MNVKTTFTSDSKQLEATLHKLERQNTKLIEQNRRLAGESRRASAAAGKQADSAGRAADRAVGSIARMAAGYLSMQAAINLVVQSLKDKEVQEAKSRDATLSVADAQIKALRNLGPVAASVQKDFTDQIAKMAAETPVAGGEATLYSAASTGLSASGGNVKATMDAIRAAVAIAPESAQEIEAISGALLHLGKATGTFDAEKNLGFLLGVGQQAAVTSTEKIAANLAPGIIGATGYGGTAQESGAIIAALTQGMADPEGRKASTAAVNMAKQLEAFLPEKTTYKTEEDKRTGKITKVADVEGTGLRTTAERIRYMQENAEARQRFLAQATFETKAQIPIEQLLGATERGDATRKSFEEALQKIPKAEDAGQIAREMAESVKRPFQQQIAGQQRAADALADSLDRDEGGRARAKAGVYSVENLDKMLQKSGMGFIARTAEAIDYRVRRKLGDTAKTAYGAVAKRRAVALRRQGRTEEAEQIEAEWGTRADERYRVPGAQPIGRQWERQPEPIAAPAQPAVAMPEPIAAPAQPAVAMPEPIAAPAQPAVAMPEPIAAPDPRGRGLWDLMPPENNPPAAAPNQPAGEDQAALLREQNRLLAKIAANTRRTAGRSARPDPAAVAAGRTIHGEVVE